MRARWPTVMLLIACTQACSGSTTVEPRANAQQPVLGTPVEINVAYGHEEAVPGTDMDVGFASVYRDYRCPVDVTCGKPGSAIVELDIAFADGPGTRFLLNTQVEPRSLALGNYLITVVGLSPQRQVGMPIPPSEYEVKVRVESIRS